MEISNLKQIGERLADLRDILGFTAADMAKFTDTTEEEYIQCEKGMRDMSISFLCKAAQRLRVDLTDLIMGEAPKLSVYTVTKKGNGLPVERRHGFDYQNMAYMFSDRKIEPFTVRVPFTEEAVEAPIHMCVHDGHEFDMIIKGTLKMVINDKVEILNEGDCIYLNSKWPHGMVAVGGEDCHFLAIVIPETDADTK